MDKIAYSLLPITDIQVTLTAATQTSLFAAPPTNAIRAIVTFSADVQVSFARTPTLDPTVVNGAHSYKAGTYEFGGSYASFPSVKACPVGVGCVANVTYLGG